MFTGDNLDLFDKNEINIKKISYIISLEIHRLFLIFVMRY